MISYLKGIIVQKSPTRLILDVSGIGFDIQITINCSKQIGSIGERITILTYLHVREDNLQLFGFNSKEERTLFLQLITTPGIGPKKALAILSGSNVNDLQRYIVEENLAALTSLSGVGRRTAQRLIVDLKEKLIPASSADQILPSAMIQEKRNLIDEAIMALESLGYNKNMAQRAIHSIIEQQPDKINLEDLIKQALRKL